MSVELLLRDRKELEQGGFIELVLWKLPERTADRPHGYKYRLVYVRKGECVVRYDNETRKGDHRHLGAFELTYRFTTVDALLRDFMRDVRRMGRST